ncbi:MAG: hypothetical protein JST92_13820 [Deltaproteobacteria bacterium]|nr:hypothetical protein [Deltaproteobacteria bacterium]
MSEGLISTEAALELVRAHPEAHLLDYRVLLEPLLPDREDGAGVRPISPGGPRSDRRAAAARHPATLFIELTALDRGLDRRPTIRLLFAVDRRTRAVHFGDAAEALLNA